MPWLAAIPGYIASVASGVGSAIGSGASAVGSALGSAGSAIGSGVGSAAQGVGSALGSAGQAIGSGAQSVGQAIGIGGQGAGASGSVAVPATSGGTGFTATAPASQVAAHSLTGSGTFPTAVSAPGQSMSTLGTTYGIPGGKAAASSGPAYGPGYLSQMGTWMKENPEFLMQQGQGATQSRAKPPPPGNFPGAQPRPVTPLPGAMQRPTRSQEEIERMRRLGGIGLY